MAAENSVLEDYLVTITAKLPGRDKAAPFDIVVKAASMADAYAEGEAEWKRATEPRDVRVKLMDKSVSKE